MDTSAPEFDDMEQESQDQHLSRISTLWTVVCHAKGGPAEAATAAQEELMRRYRRAVYRYLLGALREADVADELTQEFALRFLRGDCRQADPQRGRFRDFVKGVLFHLIVDYHRRKRVQPQPLLADGAEPAAADPSPDDLFDRGFRDSWREELLARTWDGLAGIQKETGQPFHAVLRFRIEHPDLRSSQMAEQLSAQLKHAVTADWVRQTLHRGRDKFADLLLAEVADTLQNPTSEELQSELSDLGLLTYCQPALKRYRRRPR
jgi:DNA-directed RNA polymerase specialized sigma24 family protein